MTFQLDYDDICLEQDQHGWVEFYVTNSLKQFPRCSRVTPLGHIILLPSHEVFALTQLCCVLSREAKNTSFIAFGMHRPRLEHAIYCSRVEYANHYRRDAVLLIVVRGNNLSEVTIFQSRSFFVLPYYVSLRS